MEKRSILFLYEKSVFDPKKKLSDCFNGSQICKQQNFPSMGDFVS